jgi:hypothetical protein
MFNTTVRSVIIFCHLFGALFCLLMYVLIFGWRVPVNEYRYEATIRVDGRDYTADAVIEIYRRRPGWWTQESTQGRLLTFRLPDDRVVALGTWRWANRLRCAPAIMTTNAQCISRWLEDSSRRMPDGYIFNSASSPTQVEAFQFEPHHEEFGQSGTIEVVRTSPRVPISGSVVELVSFRETLADGANGADGVARDFPGSEGVWLGRTGRRVSSTSTPMGIAASHLGMYRSIEWR